MAHGGGGHAAAHGDGGEGYAGGDGDDANNVNVAEWDALLPFLDALFAEVGSRARGARAPPAREHAPALMARCHCTAPAPRRDGAEEGPGGARAASQPGARALRARQPQPRAQPNDLFPRVRDLLLSVHDEDGRPASGALTSHLCKVHCDLAADGGVVLSAGERVEGAAVLVRGEAGESLPRAPVVCGECRLTRVHLSCTILDAEQACKDPGGVRNNASAPPDRGARCHRRHGLAGSPRAHVTLPRLPLCACSSTSAA